MNIKERQKIVLAALLHDIGKFWERADGRYDESEIIKQEFPNKEYNHTVPTYDTGYPRYTHALWSQAFLHKFEIGKHLNLEESGDQNLATLSARHHKPSNFLEAIISLADKWSSSIDRPEEEEEGAKQYNKVKEKWGDHFSKKILLESIFDVIHKDNLNEIVSHSLNLNKLNVFGESLFAKNTEYDKTRTKQNQYKELWKEFEKEIDSLMKRCNEFDSFYISLNDILRSYTWCMPSAANTFPSNVSLYEHLKTTAAIALSLYDFLMDFKQNGHDFFSKDLQTTIGKEDSLLMVCIDISGIQKYIYDIASKKAAQSLKGRSFYLTLLMQHILDKILSHKDIEAYSTNVIYSSGGKAFLILPNLEKVTKALDSIDIHFQKYLWKEHQGKLYACIGYVAFNYQTFFSIERKWANTLHSSELSEIELKKHNIDPGVSMDLGKLWAVVTERAAAKKHRKFKSLLNDNEVNLFEPNKYELNLEKCDVTGDRSKDLVCLETGIVFSEMDRQKGNAKVLPSIYKQIQLGKNLKDSNYVVQYSKANDEVEFTIKIDDEVFEIKSQEKIIRLPDQAYDRGLVNRFNKTNNDVTAKNVGVRTIFYGGNIQPEYPTGDYKTFEDLALTEGNKATKLGILRMDVDNLGQVFIYGFDEKVQKKSFAAYSTLSFMLDAFFSGYINNIHQSNEKFKNFIQILYSGGDDLFAVGRWDAVIEFAAEVREAFRKFVNRGDITISAGIAIVGSSYPIMKGADLAGEMEEKAKDFKNSDKVKDAICLFGEVVGWGKEFDFVRHWKDFFLEGNLSSSFLFRLQQYKIEKDKNSFTYVWNSAYNITRYIQNVDQANKKTKEKLNELRSGIINHAMGSERFIDLIAIASVWSLQILKMENE